MKILVFLLAAYVLICSTVPCCSMNDCDATSETAQSSTTNKDDNCAACSPFFTCGSCAGFAVGTRGQEIEHALFNVANHYSGYYLVSLPDYVSSFWQPPKIG